MTPPRGWTDLVERANAYLRREQARLQSEHDLGGWQRYDYDQEQGLLTFSNGGRPGLVCAMSIVGSTSKRSATWSWSWSNASILERARLDITEVRALGEANGFEKLTSPRWPGDETDAWEMTAVTALVLQAEGAYRAPDQHGATFMILRDVRRLLQPDAGEQGSPDDRRV